MEGVDPPPAAAAAAAAAERRAREARAQQPEQRLNDLLGTSDLATFIEYFGGTAEIPPQEWIDAQPAAAGIDQPPAAWLTREGEKKVMEESKMSQKAFHFSFGQSHPLSIFSTPP